MSAGRIGRALERGLLALVAAILLGVLVMLVLLAIQREKGPSVFLDRATGCYYIGYPKSAITPRMMGDGEQLCVTPEDVEP